MAHPSPRHVALAHRIVEQEAGGSSDPAASAAALESACRRVRDYLVDLLGSGGVSALIRRGLHLAQREQPVLAEVTVTGTDVCFSGLAEALAASTEEEARAVVATVFAHLLELLVMLLGGELGMKPIRKLWPEVTTAGEIQE